MTARSVIAQAAAELLRIRHLNTGGSNPFSCIDSAGSRVHSDLVTESNVGELIRSNRLSDGKAIAVLFQHRYSQEELDIRRRLEKRGCRGMVAEDFTDFDYIVTFDRKGLEQVESLRTLATSKGTNSRALVTLLSPPSLYCPPSEISFRRRVQSSPSPSEYATLVNSIVLELDRFIHYHTSRRSPTWTIDYNNTPLRSRQFLMPGVCQLSGVKLKHLTNTFGPVNVDKPSTSGSGKGRVVTITAERHEIQELYRLARKLFRL